MVPTIIHQGLDFTCEEKREREREAEKREKEGRKRKEKGERKKKRAGVRYTS